jgi:glucan phosphoethanolaminetransferase (alkaline phosphatase superfamily)
MFNIFNEKIRNTRFILTVLAVSLLAFFGAAIVILIFLINSTKIPEGLMGLLTTLMGAIIAIVSVAYNSQFKASEDAEALEQAKALVQAKGPEDAKALVQAKGLEDAKALVQAKGLEDAKALVQAKAGVDDTIRIAADAVNPKTEDGGNRATTASL